MKMKTTFNGLKKETIKLLSQYLGITVDCVIEKQQESKQRYDTATPDFCNTRMNNAKARNVNPNHRPS